MNNTFDVAIIGGGIIGSSIAYQLAKQGRKVLILEKGQLACQSSSAAAGMLAAQAEIEQDGPLLQLALKSQALFPDLAAELYEYSRIDIEWVQKGMLKVAETEYTAEELKEQVTFQRNWDPEISWLDSKEAIKMEPALASHVHGAMYLPNDGHVQSSKLAHAYAKAAKYFGAEILEDTEVLSLIDENNHITGVKTTKGTIHCRQVVVATGAWANHLLAETAFKIPIFPVKGECFSVVTEQPLINRTIFSDKRCYLVPKRNGEIYIGATMIENTYDQQVRAGGIAGLAERAIHLVPAIKDAEWKRVWAGIRPQTGDGKPYIGEHSDKKGLFVAAGHFRNGILLSPITGILVASLLDGSLQDDPLLSAFSLERNLVGGKR